MGATNFTGKSTNSTVSRGPAPEDLQVSVWSYRRPSAFIFQIQKYYFHFVITAISQQLTVRNKAANTTAVGRENSKQVYTQKFLYTSSSRFLGKQQMTTKLKQPKQEFIRKKMRRRSSEIKRYVNLTQHLHA